MGWKEHNRDTRANIREMNTLIPETSNGFGTLANAVKNIPMFWP